MNIEGGMKMKYKVIPRLGEILKERNLTQKQLSEMTGISQPVISRFDKNTQHLDVHLVTIARTLNISIDDLFYVEEQFEIDDM
jgi:transcriptional regulator with XRE-family HTH domain